MMFAYAAAAVGLYALFTWLLVGDNNYDYNPFPVIIFLCIAYIVAVPASIAFFLSENKKQENENQQVTYGDPA